MAESARKVNQGEAYEYPIPQSQASALTNSLDNTDLIDIKQDGEGRDFIEVSCGDTSGVLYFKASKANWRERP